MSSHCNLCCCLHRLVMLAKASVSRYLLQTLWMMETLIYPGLYQGWLSLSIMSSPHFTKCEYELGTVCDLKRSQHAKYLPLMVKLKPFSCGLRWGGGQALGPLVGFLWESQPPFPADTWRGVGDQPFSEVQPQQAHVLLPVCSRGFPATFRRLQAS